MRPVIISALIVLYSGTLMASGPGELFPTPLFSSDNPPPSEVIEAARNLESSTESREEIERKRYRLCQEFIQQPTKKARPLLEAWIADPPRIKEFVIDCRKPHEKMKYPYDDLAGRALFALDVYMYRQIIPDRQERRKLIDGLPTISDRKALLTAFYEEREGMTPDELETLILNMSFDEVQTPIGSRLVFESWKVRGERRPRISIHDLDQTTVRNYYRQRERFDDATRTMIEGAASYRPDLTSWYHLQKNPQHLSWPPNNAEEAVVLSGGNLSDSDYTSIAALLNGDHLDDDQARYTIMALMLADTAEGKEIVSPLVDSLPPAMRDDVKDWLE